MLIVWISVFNFNQQSIELDKNSLALKKVFFRTQEIALIWFSLLGLCKKLDTA